MNGVFEFADVPRPAVSEQPLQRVFRQLALLYAEARRKRSEKVSRERNEIQRSIAEWREREARHVKTVIEVLAELFISYGLLEVGIRGHDEAYVDWDGPAGTDPDHFVLLKNPQELHLCGER
jgi:hypothetical protein